MENQTSTASQSKAARLAGLLYLIAMATGLFAEFYADKSIRYHCFPRRGENNYTCLLWSYRYRQLLLVFGSSARELIFLKGNPNTLKVVLYYSKKVKFKTFP